MSYGYDLVFLLEERSMKEMLEVLLPRILPETIKYICIAHEGKSDLERSIPRKLKAWNSTITKFVIVRDQDSGNCSQVKQQLLNLSRQGQQFNILIRIACRELESWYLGDLEAVEQCFKIKQGKLSKLQNNQKYRNPDSLGSPKEELKKELAKHNCEYQPINSSREIAKFLSITDNTSHSFQVFVNGVKSFIA